MWRAVIAVLLLAATLATGGCSVVRLVYENADWLVLREIDHYVDLDEAQRERLAAVLAAGLDAHRRDELPDIVALLRDARSAASDGLTDSEVGASYRRARELFERTATNGIPAIVAAIGRLDPGQIEHLEREFTERDEAYREKYLPDSRAERLARRLERTLERIEYWTGTLSDPQRALVAGLRNEMPDSAEAWLAYRQHMQSRLVALLRGGAGPAAVSGFLIDWWARLAERDPALVRTGTLLEAGIRRIVVDLDATLDERQRAHALKRLDGYIEALGAALEPRVPASPPAAPSPTDARSN